MQVSAYAAAWFLPFVVPLCLYVVYTDISVMKITNRTNLALAAVFAVVGVFVMPFDLYLWGFAGLIIMLVVGMLLNAMGVMGAGDSKFLAAAAPFVAVGDLGLLMWLFLAVLLAAYATHRLVKRSPLRAWAPDWVSWHSDNKFPMGMALGPALILYLSLGALYGA